MNKEKQQSPLDGLSRGLDLDGNHLDIGKIAADVFYLQMNIEEKSKKDKE